MVISFLGFPSSAGNEAEKEKQTATKIEREISVIFDRMILRLVQFSGHESNQFGHSKTVGNMNLIIGEKVRFLDEVGGGIVKSIDRDMLTVEDEHGFDHQVSAMKVVAEKRGGYIPKFKGNVEIRAEPEQKLVSQNLAEFHRKAKTPFLEIDLHIHHLVDDERHMSNHQMLGVQLRVVREMLASAKVAKYKKVVFIHGVGNGTLRNEIRTLIAQESNCEYVDANYADYGYGATEIKLWYN